MKLRHELKFTLHKEAAKLLKSRMAMLLPYDGNADRNGEYMIRSLYFDTPDSSAYYEKMDGVENRKKYRIRYYNQNTGFIRLECKEKFNQMTQKRQVRISLDQAKRFIAGDIEAMDIEGEDLLREFLIEMKTKHLIPSVIVDYRRTAFVMESLDVRITFDETIHSRVFNHDLFEVSHGGVMPMEEVESVVEIKYNDVLPSSIVAVLNSMPMTRQALSKFALCRGMQ